MRARAAAIFIAMALVAAACGDGNNGNEASAPEGRGDETGATAPRATGEAVRGTAGIGAIPPDEFPNIAEVDFSKFPRRLPIPPQPASGGRTLYVEEGAEGGDGSAVHPFGSPVNAVRAAKSGDVVLIRDGTYRPVDDRCGCALALWTDGVAVAAEHPGAVIFEPGPEVRDGLVLRGEHLAVVGLRLAGFRDGLTAGEEEYPVRDVVLQGLVLEGSGILIGLAGSEDPEQVPVDGMLVADTQIVGGDNLIVGLNCAQGPCNNVRISALTIALTPSGSGESGMDDIGFESGDNVVVEATEVSGADGDGVDLKASRAVVINSFVHDIERNGVKLWKGGDVINTIIVDTDADAAVVFQTPARYRILHSVIARHIPEEVAYGGTVSYDQPGDGRLEFINSIYYDNSGAFWISGEYDIDVRNSIFYRSNTDQFLVWARGDEILLERGTSFGALSDAGGGSDNREVDPGFVDPEGNDFHLADDSPGRGAGTTDIDDYPDFDFDGNARGTGAPNLGPYQGG